MAKKQKEFSAKEVAVEMKEFFIKNVYDLVDYNIANIQCLIVPDKKMKATIWAANRWVKWWDKSSEALGEISEAELDVVFKEAKDKGEDPHVVIMKKYIPKLYEEKVKYDEFDQEITNIINNDESLWNQIRQTVIPLYEKSQYFEQWKTRWKKVSLKFDPVEMTAKTTKLMKNQKDEIVSSEIFRLENYPEGYFLEVD